jgi:hypothetical protein
MTTLYIFFFILLIILLILVSINIVINNFSTKQINGGVESTGALLLPTEALPQPTEAPPLPTEAPPQPTEAPPLPTEALPQPIVPSNDEILPTPDKSDAPIFSDSSITLMPMKNNTITNINKLQPIYPSILNKPNPDNTQYDDIVSEIIALAIDREFRYEQFIQEPINRLKILDSYSHVLSEFSIDNIYKNKGLNLILHTALANNCTTLLEIQTHSGLLSEQLKRYAKYKNINNLDIPAATTRWRLRSKNIRNTLAYTGEGGIQKLDMVDAVKFYDDKWKGQKCIFLMLQLYSSDETIPLSKLLDNLLELLNNSYGHLKVIIFVYTSSVADKKYYQNIYLAQLKKFTKYNFERSVYSNHTFGEYVFMGGGDEFVNDKLILFTREANATVVKKSMCSIS